MTFGAAMRRIAFATLCCCLTACATSAPVASAPAAGATVAPPSTAPATDATPLEQVRDLPAKRALQAAFLVVDGVYNTELTAPFDILHHTVFHVQPGIEVFTVSPDGEAVTSFEGITLEVDHSFASAPRAIDILVVPSAEHSMGSDLENKAMIAWVRETGRRARWVMSLCDGAFVLAAAGLLDGHAVTTFPGDQDRFAEMFPHLDLRRGISYVHDRAMITSQGGARSFDPALYLVAHLYGDDVARGVGRGMVMPWPPAPGTVPALVMTGDR